MSRLLFVGAYRLGFQTQAKKRHMERRQQHAELEEIGGDPLECSGFENEEPVTKDEPVFTISPDQHKGEAS